MFFLTSNFAFSSVYALLMLHPGVYILPKKEYGGRWMGRKKRKQWETEKEKGDWVKSWGIRLQIRDWE